MPTCCSVTAGQRERGEGEGDTSDANILLCHCWTEGEGRERDANMLLCHCRTEGEGGGRGGHK